MTRARAEIDLAALRRNLGRVREVAQSAAVMAVVKADAYGHGMGPVARAARAAGAQWLGVALPSEALALRSMGDEGRILAWLWAPSDPALEGCVRAGVDLSVSSRWALAEVAEAARRSERAARIQVKIDTGLSRNGVTLSDLPSLLDDVVAAQGAGLVEVEAIWSHLADGDLPGSDTVPKQLQRYLEAVALAGSRGIHPRLRHLANSGATFAFPECRFDLVRVGIAMYGLTPSPQLGSAAELGLEPVMTLRARLSNVKAVGAGTSVSYGGTWTATAPTVLGLVPVGYADGVPRAAGGRVDVAIAGRRCPAVGRIAMDQFVVDLGPGGGQHGDDVFLFGPGRHGEATADEWAELIDTIGYEVVTRVGSRVPREYVGDSDTPQGDNGTDES
ncbi:MAG: alanine racemase [Actinobacteria bacterium]|nr:alanine racemase [Actinomycetota bacterium]